MKVFHGSYHKMVTNEKIDLILTFPDSTDALISGREFKGKKELQSFKIEQKNLKVQWFQSNYLSTLNNKVSLTINELDLDSPEGSICGSGILVRLSLPVQVQFRRNVPNISDLDLGYPGEIPFSFSL